VALGLGFGLALGACRGAGTADAPRTDQTTQDLLQRGTEPAPAGDATQLPSAGQPDGPVPPDERIPIAPLGLDYGSDQAPVQVLEMSDYGCGYCRRFHEETWPVLLSEFVDTDRVQWKFVPFVTGMFANSQAVTVAAECALEQDPGVFVRLSDRLWRDQAEWKGSAEASALVRGWAGEAGADPTRFDACVAGGDALRRVATSTALSRQLRVRGTPTFFVVGYAPIQGALPTALFRELLDAAHRMSVSARGDG
jgi:protein-disulfide isomerase